MRFVGKSRLGFYLLPLSEAQQIRRFLHDEGELSCSAVAALERQEPFINSTLAQHALALLARLFRYGEISYHGGFINLATGASSVLRIDPQHWERTRRFGKRSSQVHQN